METTRRRALALALAAVFVRVEASAKVETRSVRDVQMSISTVTPRLKERINEQVPPGAPLVMKAADLRQSAVGPGYTLIPLPAFSYNRNESAWIGALAPLFRANEQGEVEDIFAPLYLHNRLIGETFTFNYFGYRHTTTQYHAIISHATKIERTVDFSYRNSAALDGRYIVGIIANSGKSAFNRFFGGNASRESKESQYTMGDANFKLTGGFRLAAALSILAAERYRAVGIEDGASPSLPQTSQSFASLPGVEGAKVVGHSLTLAYDTRDNELTPLRGVYATAFAEYDQNIKFAERNRWWRLTGEGRWFLPHAGGRLVFVAHALVDGVVGQDNNSFTTSPDSLRLIRRGVPFFERPTLGGETTLRGFGRGRFVGNTAYLANLEERISVAERTIKGNVIELEVAPFVDMGRVGAALDADDILKAIQVNPGIGIRALARPNVACRLDVGYGRDGANAFAGLDYPF